VAVQQRAKVFVALALVGLLAGPLAWAAVRHASPAILLVGGAAVLLAAIAVWILPRLQVPQGVTDPKDRAELENSARDIVIKTVAGIFLFSGAYATWAQLQLAQDSNIAERYNNAISHLGASREKEVSKIIGAVYALERIAADSERDHWPVMVVLTAYIRQTAAFSNVNRDEACRWRGPRNAEAPLDIQAALTVISRRRVSQDKPNAVLDLAAVDLRHAYLMDAKLRGAFLFATNLCGAWLMRASLVGANLHGAILKDADLSATDLSGAILSGVDLSETKLGKAILKGAKYSKNSRWPKGFDPKAAGAQEVAE
jgi:hypothetical protein